jgi:polar amino acid transport system ATP-binding protein
VEAALSIGMTVNSGDAAGIIGSSGSGKSTLLRRLNLLEIPDAGRFSFGNLAFDMTKVKKHEIMKVRRSTAMVFQQFDLFKYKTALENVMECPLAAQKKPKAEVKEMAEHRLVKVGLSGRMNHYPSQLSGGQQQRPLSAPCR